MNWICLGLVIISYLLGHATGYRLCKIRVKNMLRKRIQNADAPPQWHDLYGKALHEIVTML